MVMEKFDTVDAYIAARDAKVQKILQNVRSVITAAAPDAQEGMSYGMPGYALEGRPLLYFGAFATHWSLFPAGDVERLGPVLMDRLEPHRAGKGTLKFPYGDGVPEELVRAVVQERVRQNRAPAP